MRRSFSPTMPQITRLVALARAGLSDQAVAVVLKLDEGIDLPSDTVRYYRRKFGGVRHPVRGHGLAGASRVEA